VIAAGGDSSRFAAEKTFATIDRPALSGFEGYRSFATALRAHGHRFGFGETSAPRALALGLAGLAALGLVLEVLVVEEVLLSRRKNKICSAIHAL